MRDEHGYAHGYLTVQRYVRGMKRRRPEVADVMEHPPGEEAQVDYFRSPAPVLDAATGRWGRPWVFRTTLSCSKHGYEEALWSQHRTGFLRAHEHAFRCFGGVPKVIRHVVARTLKAHLGPDATDAAWAEGGSMPLEEAIRWARRARGARKRPSIGWESLTPTELRIVELVADGLTNHQIADRMFISAGTAKVHLGHIFQKLDVHSRSGLVAYAVKRTH